MRLLSLTVLISVLLFASACSKKSSCPTAFAPYSGPKSGGKNVATVGDPKSVDAAVGSPIFKKRISFAFLGKKSKGKSNNVASVQSSEPIKRKRRLLSFLLRKDVFKERRLGSASGSFAVSSQEAPKKKRKLLSWLKRKDVYKERKLGAASGAFAVRTNEAPKKKRKFMSWLRRKDVYKEIELGPANGAFAVQEKKAFKKKRKFLSWLLRRNVYVHDNISDGQATVKAKEKIENRNTRKFMSRLRRKKVTKQSDTKRDKMANKLFKNKRKETGLFGPGVTKLSKID